MARTVINQTANKQTIILNDSPEGVEGGYFDEEMVWHEFGGSDAFAKVTITLEMDTSVTDAFTFDSYYAGSLYGFLDIDGDLYFGDGTAFTSEQPTIELYYPKNVYSMTNIFTIVEDMNISLQNGGNSVDTTGYSFYYEITDSDCVGENGNITGDGSITLALNTYTDD